MKQRSGASLDLVFDGRCGFCTRSASWLARRDRRGRVRLHPFQRPGVLERFELSREEAQRSVWAFREGAGSPPAPGQSFDGAPRRPSASSRSGRSGAPPGVRGAAAVSAALDTALGVRVFSGLHRLPGIGRLEERAYRFIAARRHRFRGTTPWCETHPEDCEDRS